jgi:sulfur transfer protein SufE
MSRIFLPRAGRLDIQDRPLATALDDIVAEMSEADAEDRKEILIDFARSLPPLPERYAAQ